ncbi:hypothetical protein IGI52_000566 [Enterococcus sp. DIV0187]
MSMRRKKTVFELSMVIVLYVLFLIGTGLTQLFPLKEQAVLSWLILFGISAGIAIICYGIVRTTKVSRMKIRSDRTTNIWLAILGVMMVLFLLVVIDVSTNIGTLLSSDFDLLITSFLSAASAGIFEEFLVRVLVFSAFLKVFEKSAFSLVWASVLSSLLFGLLHFPNLTTQSLDATLQQIFYATVLGFVFSVLRIRSNGIIWAVLLHFLIDFAPTIASSSGESAVSWGLLLIVFIPIAVVSIICLFRLNKNNTGFGFAL